jgi:thiamine biosynthesis lipoprotein
MGTLVEATVYYDDVEVAQASLIAAFQEMERIEAIMSVHLPTSELSYVNARAADEAASVSGELLNILSRAKQHCDDSNGLFDVSVGPLVSLWGFNDDSKFEPPSQEEIELLLPKVGCESFALDHSASTVRFIMDGVSLDLGGIAKGYAVDRASQVLKDNGITNFLLNAGGDLYASGDKGNGVPWMVGVKHPRKPSKLMARLSATNVAVVSSGDYERFSIVDSIRYHHIIDPRTGYPATGSRSVSVLADSAEEADVMATIIFISGANTIDDDRVKGYLRVGTNGELFGASTLRDRNLEILPD